MFHALTPNAARQGFFARRWHAQMAWQTLFWRDMLMVGSVANLLLGFASLVMVAQRMETNWAVAVHFALLPYNLFLVMSVWRWPDRRPKWKWAAGAWLLVMLVV
jgi:hypothetical protein